MAHCNSNTPTADNVYDIFSGRPLSDNKPGLSRIIRISPELDGLCMLYANQSDYGKYYSMKILCWALRENGDIDAMVPWLNRVVCCSELTNDRVGQWEGYYNPYSSEIFYDPPTHKVLELETSARYFNPEVQPELELVQEFADPVGTHALFIECGGEQLTLAEVAAWRLNGRGEISAMLINEAAVTDTPVLPGDPCLYPAETHPGSRYFFQHHAANQIKAQDPEAMAAIALLIGD